MNYTRTMNRKTRDTQFYTDQLSYIQTRMTADPATGEIRFKAYVPLSEFDTVEDYTFFNRERAGRLLFEDSRDAAGYRTQWISHNLYHADYTAFILYHQRLPVSALIHTNGIVTRDTLNNLVEQHTVIETQDHLTKREDVMQVLKDAFTYNPETGEFQNKELGVEYFKSEAEHKRYNARRKQPFLNINRDGYHETEVFGKTYKAQIVAYALVNDCLPDCQLRFKDNNRSNFIYDNIQTRITKSGSTVNRLPAR